MRTALSKTMTLDIEGIRISQSDVNELSRQWQLVVMNVEYASSAVAMRILSALVMSYLRGRGCRMGSPEGLSRHMGKAGALIRAVSEDATQRYDNMRQFEKSVSVYLSTEV